MGRTMYCDVLKHPTLFLSIVFFCHGCSFLWDPYEGIACQQASQCPTDGYRCYQGECRKGKKGCGDLVVEGDEACDDGLNNSDTLADACRTTCVAAACGDGVIDTDEVCDDGNGVAADGCDQNCEIDTAHWAPDFRILGSGYDDQVMSLLADQQHALLAGSFCDNASAGTSCRLDFDESERSLTSFGGGDGFLLRTGALSELEKLLHLGSSAQDTVHRLVGLGESEVYALVQFCGSAADSSCTLSYSLAANEKTGLLTTVGDQDLALMRLNRVSLMPSPTETIHLASSGLDRFGDVGVFADGSFVVVGAFSCSTPHCFGQKLDTELLGAVSNQGGEDAFMALFDSSGVLTMMQSAGGLSNDVASEVEVLSDGGFLIAGNFCQGSDGACEIDFKGVGCTLSSAGKVDVFVARYSASGQCQWIKGFGGDKRDTLSQLIVDASDSIYITGQYCKNGTPLNCELNVADEAWEQWGGADGFFAKLDADGELEWLHTMRSVADEVLTGLNVGDNGLLKVMGSFCQDSTVTCALSYSTTIEGDDQGSVNSSGKSDIFVLTYSSDGEFNSIETWGGTQDDAANGLACFPDGTLLLAGTVAGHDDAPSYLDDATLLDTQEPKGQDIFLKQVLPASE